MPAPRPIRSLENCRWRDQRSRFEWPFLDKMNWRYRPLAQIATMRSCRENDGVGPSCGGRSGGATSAAPRQRTEQPGTRMDEPTALTGSSPLELSV